MKDNNRLGGLGVYDRIILKWILRKCLMCGLNSEKNKLGSSGEITEDINEPSCCSKRGKSLFSDSRLIFFCKLFVPHGN